MQIENFDPTIVVIRESGLTITELELELELTPDPGPPNLP